MDSIEWIDIEWIAAVLASSWDELPAYFGDAWISVLPQRLIGNSA